MTESSRFSPSVVFFASITNLISHEHKMEMTVMMIFVPVLLLLLLLLLLFLLLLLLSFLHYLIFAR